MKAWYAIHTYSGHENKVKTNIERRAESLGLRDRIGRVLVPEEEETRVRSGKKSSIKRKVFPGYVLIEMDLDDQTWYLVKNTIGVTGFISSGNRPVPLQRHEVQNILDAMESKVPLGPTWKKGDVIRVNAGPFADFNGVIDEVLPDKNKIKAMIELFGRETSVEFDFDQIEKV